MSERLFFDREEMSLMLSISYSDKSYSARRYKWRITTTIFDILKEAML